MWQTFVFFSSSLGPSTEQIPQKGPKSLIWEIQELPLCQIQPMEMDIFTEFSPNTHDDAYTWIDGVDHPKKWKNKTWIMLIFSIV
jgi:hypothetical protein